MLSPLGGKDSLAAFDRVNNEKLDAN